MIKNKISKLIPLRKAINNIDKALFKLLRKRSFIVPKVKRVKESWDYKIAFKREVEMAKKIAKQDFGLYKSNFMQKIWREIISATLYIEGNLKIIIYRNFNLWEITKDHFSGTVNLEVCEDIPSILNELIAKNTECIVLPDFKDSPIKWWTLLLEEEYNNIKINFQLPYLGGIKTFGNAKGFILSLNNQDIFSENLLYIIEKTINITLDINLEILDKTPTHLLIKSKLSVMELEKQLQIPQNKIKFIGSYTNTLI
ncbi:MAG: chorismate mutase [Alphaproteobacteria bacterium]|jgi:chorismate mutase|nr:chorismate mutase [Alphaproteobacteria bacterium]